jgi:ribulose-phosphate 3-epimerase
VPETLLAPSILSCDLARLEAQVAAVERAGADWLHVDIMDGHFVPALTFGPKMVETLRRLTSLPLDVHLMVEDPDRWVEPFIAAGAGTVSFHLEACHHPRRLLRHIRSLGARAGLALNPATPPESLRYLAPELDLVVVMSVDPGFAAQPFLPETLPKLSAVRAGLDVAAGSECLVEVDGGVGPANAKALVAAGASVLVAGNSVFGQADPGAALVALRQAAR